MSDQMIFQRYELKYLLTCRQKEAVLQAMAPYMKPDRYPCATIRNIYFDTENYRLIRSSLDKPVYKEKLRIRSYRRAEPADPVFVELKKKYDSVVYKRRLVLPEETVMDCFATGKPLPVQSQIASEIEYFRSFYGSLRPAVFLSYEREAWFDPAGSDLRITFDNNILFRQNHLSLERGVYGEELLPPGHTLLEIKTSRGIPLWLCRVLTEEQIQKTSYSKYGSAYCRICAANGIKQVGILPDCQPSFGRLVPFPQVSAG